MSSWTWGLGVTLARHQVETGRCSIDELMFTPGTELEILT